MPDIFFNLMKQYADDNPMVNDFFGMMQKGGNRKIEDDKILNMKMIHDLEYQKYIFIQKQCEKLGGVIVVIGVLNRLYKCI